MRLGAKNQHATFIVLLPDCQSFRGKAKKARRERTIIISFVLMDSSLLGRNHLNRNKSFMLRLHKRSVIEKDEEAEKRKTHNESEWQENGETIFAHTLDLSSTYETTNIYAGAAGDWLRILAIEIYHWGLLKLCECQKMDWSLKFPLLSLFMNGCLVFTMAKCILSPSFLRPSELLIFIIKMVYERPTTDCTTFKRRIKDFSFILLLCVGTQNVRVVTLS